jgi:hypothetical protein
MAAGYRRPAVRYGTVANLQHRRVASLARLEMEQFRCQVPSTVCDDVIVTAAHRYLAPGGARARA